MSMPVVIQAHPHNDYTVDIVFQDGKKVCYDASPLVGKGVFKVLEDKDFFLERCIVINNTLAWDLSGQRDPKQCLDIDPLVLYSL